MMTSVVDPVWARYGLSPWHLHKYGRPACGVWIGSRHPRVRIAPSEFASEPGRYVCRTCARTPSTVPTWLGNRDGWACLRCGATEWLQVDHIVPFSLGGGWTWDNLQTLCRSCNCSKGTKTINYRTTHAS